jgi:hypothetical protein
MDPGYARDRQAEFDVARYGIRGAGRKDKVCPAALLYRSVHGWANASGYSIIHLLI